MPLMFLNLMNNTNEANHAMTMILHAVINTMFSVVNQKCDGIAKSVDKIGSCRDLNNILSLRTSSAVLIRYRIIFKLCLMMHNAHVDRSLRYIIDSLADGEPAQPQATTFMSEQQVALHLKIGERAFSYSEPAFWNSLPSELTSIIDKSRLKNQSILTHLWLLTNFVMHSGHSLLTARSPSLQCRRRSRTTTVLLLLL